MLTIIQTAAAKGLVAGNFTLKGKDGTQASRKPDVVSVVLRASKIHSNH